MELNPKRGVKQVLAMSTSTNIVVEKNGDLFEKCTFPRA